MDILALLKGAGLLDLEKNRGAVRQWFALAIVKKLGVLKQPYHCRTQDGKINPDAGALLVAALFMDDDDAVATVLGVIQKEEEDRRQASGRGYSPPSAVAQQIIDQFLAKIADEGLRGELRDRARRYGVF